MYRYHWIMLKITDVLPTDEIGRISALEEVVPWEVQIYHISQAQPKTSTLRRYEHLLY